MKERRKIINPSWSHYQEDYNRICDFLLNVIWTTSFEAFITQRINPLHTSILARKAAEAFERTRSEWETSSASCVVRLVQLTLKLESPDEVEILIENGEYEHNLS